MIYTQTSFMIGKHLFKFHMENYDSLAANKRNGRTNIAKNCPEVIKTFKTKIAIFCTRSFAEISSQLPKS